MCSSARSLQSRPRICAHRLPLASGFEAPAPVIGLLRHHQVGLVINTPRGVKGRTDAGAIRMAALQSGVPCLTTLEGALAALEGIKALRGCELDIRPL